MYPKHKPDDEIRTHLNKFLEHHGEKHDLSPCDSDSSIYSYINGQSTVDTEDSFRRYEAQYQGIIDGLQYAIDGSHPPFDFSPLESGSELSLSELLTEVKEIYLNDTDIEIHHELSHYLFGWIKALCYATGEINDVTYDVGHILNQ